MHRKLGIHYFSKHCLFGFEHKAHFLGHPGSSFVMSLSVGGFRILSSYLKTRLSDLVRWRN